MEKHGEKHDEKHGKLWLIIYISDFDMLVENFVSI